MTSGTTRSRRKLRPGSSTGRAAYSPKVGGKAFIQVAQKPLCLRSLYAFVRKHGGHAELCSSSRATSYSAVFKRMRALEPDTARSKSAPNRLRKAYAQFLMPLDGALGGMGCPAWSPLVSCALHMDLASRHFTRCWGQLVQGLSPAAQAGLRECLDALLVHADVLMAVERQNFPPALASTAVADALVLPWLWEATEDPHCAEVPHQHSLVQVIATALQRGLLAQGPATLALCRLAVAVRDSPLHSAPALLFLLHTMGAAQAAKGDGTGWLAHTPCTGVLKLKVRHPRAPLGSLFPPLPPAAAGLGAQGLQDAWAAGTLPSPGVHATASNNSANTLSVVGVAGALRYGRAPADAPEWRSRALWAIAQLLLEGNNRETVHLQLALPQEQRSLTPPLGGSKRARETAPMPPPTPPPAPKRQALCPGGGLCEPQSRFGAPVRSVGLPPAWPCAPLPYAQVVGGTTSQLPHAAMMRAASMAYAASHAQSMAPSSFPRASPNTITAVSALNGLGGAAMATPVVEAMVASARQSALSRATSALGAPRHVVSHVMDGSKVLL